MARANYGRRRWPAMIEVALCGVALALGGCQPERPGVTGSADHSGHAAMPGHTGSAAVGPATPGTPTGPASPVPSWGTHSPTGHAGMSTGSGVAYDPARIPVGAPGLSAPKINLNGPPVAAAHDGVTAFRAACLYSHMRPDDPIVLPGRPGASHLHVFWGNTAVTATSTPDTVAASGNGTCIGGTVNRSSYWAPAVIDTRTGTPIAPTEVLVYYKSGYHAVDPAAIRAVPAGLRMIAGNAKATGPQDTNEYWSCRNTFKATPSIPTNCPVGDQVEMSLEFPQCWDGKNLDSPDHKSHLAYATNGCPADHPVPLPVIEFKVRYPVTADTHQDTWRLSSDMYAAAQPGGYTIHGDLINGWRPDIEDTWINHCLHSGKDCGVGNLGDGRELLRES